MTGVEIQEIIMAVSKIDMVTMGEMAERLKPLV